MSGAGFLTRLLATNERGPNVTKINAIDSARDARDEEIESEWECKVCLDRHEYQNIAINCCGNEVKEQVLLLDNALMVVINWRCGACQLRFDAEHSAQNCCTGSDLANIVYVCPECDDAHSDKEDAVNCCLPCGDSIGVDGRMPQCMLCMRAVDVGDVTDIADQLEWWSEAVRCCLPVRSDVITDVDCVSVAKLLMQGMPWVDAVALVEAAARANRDMLAVH